MENPKQVLIYDLKSLPVEEMLTAAQIIELYKEHDIVFYDSTYNGDKPEVINIGDIEVSFVDLSKQENMKKLNGYKKRLK